VSVSDKIGQLKSRKTGWVFLRSAFLDNAVKLHLFFFISWLSILVKVVYAIEDVNFVTLDTLVSIPRGA
jgi:hypothetical protein